MPPFDFSCVDWSDDDASPFDQQCDNDNEELNASSGSSCCCHPEAPALIAHDRKRTIRFALQDNVREILNRDDYSPEDIQATWYSRQDFLAMRRQVSRLLDVMEGVGVGGALVAESDSLTTRGLEYRTEQGARKRTLNKREAYCAVLSEQDRQWRAQAAHHQQQEDPDRIATVYRAVSAKCTGMALMAGIQDEQSVRDYLQDTRHELLRIRNHSSWDNPSCTKEDSCSSSGSGSDNVRKPDSVAVNTSILYRRMSVLEDIKVLSGAASPKVLQLNFSGSAAA